MSDRETQIVAAKLTGRIQVQIAVGAKIHPHSFTPVEIQDYCAAVCHDGIRWVVEVPYWKIDQIPAQRVDGAFYAGVKVFDQWLFAAHKPNTYYVPLETPYGHV